MRDRSSIVLACLALVGAVAPAQAAEPQRTADTSQHRIVLPDQIKWQAAPPGLPPGAQIAVLSGDPAAKSGEFTLRLKAPAGYHIPAHSHPTAETLTIISGSVQYAEAGADQNKAMTLPAGAYVLLPANGTHSVWAGNQGAVVEVHSTAPFDVAYLNPGDDPRKQTSSTPPQDGRY